MKKTSKILLVAVSLALIIGVAVGGTIAWLLDTTAAVVNTFTTTNVDIDLVETETDFEMVPGSEIKKDPVVSVKAGSEDCWLFVKITETANLDEYISYTVDRVWQRYQPEGTDDADEYVYVYKGNNYIASAGEAFSVIAGDKVNVLSTVTKQMMETAKTNQPQLTFQAYACQKENIDDIAIAWQNAQTLTVFAGTTTVNP